MTLHSILTYFFPNNKLSFFTGFLCYKHTLEHALFLNHKIPLCFITCTSNPAVCHDISCRWHPGCFSTPLTVENKVNIHRWNRNPQWASVWETPRLETTVTGAKVLTPAEKGTFCFLLSRLLRKPNLEAGREVNDWGPVCVSCAVNFLSP